MVLSAALIQVSNSERATRTKPHGSPIGEGEWAVRWCEWLPDDGDRAFVRSLMQRVVEPGKVAGWLAPPEIGIDNLPAAYDYVRLH